VITLLVLLFAVSGYVLLGFAIATRRRWVRVVLALTAMIVMLFQGYMMYVAAFSVDQHIPLAPFVISGVYYLSALAPLVLMFIGTRPPEPAEPKGKYVSRKQFSPLDDPADPKV
jgi:hypothetical protein